MNSPKSWDKKVSRQVPLAVLLALAWGVLPSCRTMSKEIRIAAPGDTVWSVLSDFAAYEEWNPFFTQVSGKLATGQKLHITMVPVGKKPQQFAPKVLLVESGRKIMWRGRLGMPGLFDGRHTFSIERLDEHTVLFRQKERFSGILVPFVGFKPYEKGWENMNQALAQRAARLHSDSAGTKSD